MKKQKTYVLIISEYFPAKHPRAGQPTGFEEKIKNALDSADQNMSCMECKEKWWGDCKTCAAGGHFPRKEEKLHTIRENYELWKRRIDEVNTGNAVLSVRKWSGKPRQSKQVELFRFDKDSGIGVQKLQWICARIETAIISPSINDNCMFEAIAPGESLYNTREICRNDGLSEQDFRDWFKNYDLTTPKAIIHFTPKFRY